MPAEWPRRRDLRVRVWEDQTIRALSREAEARRVPSLENLTQETAWSWAASVRRCRYGRYGGGLEAPPPVAISNSELGENFRVWFYRFSFKIFICVTCLHIENTLFASKF